MKELSLEEGAYLVRLARGVIERQLGVGEIKLPPPPESLKEPSGAFVTLNSWPRGELRGCIGFPEPLFPLIEAVAKAAFAAAFQDPRFPPLSPGEEFTVEVSVLTPPEPVPGETPEEIVEGVEVGKHGLIVRYVTGRSGLLLPQVAVEEGWDAKTFLEHTCLKAGLPPDAWTWPDTQVLRFSAQIFRETEPRGEVVRED